MGCSVETSPGYNLRRVSGWKFDALISRRALRLNGSSYLAPPSPSKCSRFQECPSCNSIAALLHIPFPKAAQGNVDLIRPDHRPPWRSSRSARSSAASWPRSSITSLAQSSTIGLHGVGPPTMTRNDQKVSGLGPKVSSWTIS